MTAVAFRVIDGTVRSLVPLTANTLRAGDDQAFAGVLHDDAPSAFGPAWRCTHSHLIERTARRCATDALAHVSDTWEWPAGGYGRGEPTARWGPPPRTSTRQTRSS